MDIVRIAGQAIDQDTQIAGDRIKHMDLTRPGFINEDIA